MKYQVVATFKDAYNRYLELSEQDNYYSKVYLKDTSYYTLVTYNDLHFVDVDYYDRYYEVVHYSWHDDAIIFVLQKREVA